MQDALGLDYLFLDAPPGVNEQTLPSIAISDAPVIAPTAGDRAIGGTAVTAGPDTGLDTRRSMPILDEILPPIDPGGVARAHPDHQVTDVLRAVPTQRA